MLVTAMKPWYRLVFTVASTCPVPGRWIPIAIIVIITAAKILMNATIQISKASKKELSMWILTNNRQPRNLQQGPRQGTNERHH